MASARRSDGNRYDRLRPLHRAIARIEVAQLRRFGRSGLSVLYRTPTLVLHTTGRRTGAEQMTPIAYHREGDGSLLVVGGAGGQARVPDWVANLRANPAASVTVERRHRAVHAAELTGTERAEVWAVLRRRWPRIDTYQRRAGRDVPVFRLVPIPPSGTAIPGGEGAALLRHRP